jgi:DNA-binding NarL/FixJ family response regulator
MPEMSGAATFEALRDVVPAAKILLASGFALEGHAPSRALLDRGCHGFIQKPFDAPTLAGKLRSIA